MTPPRELLRFGAAAFVILSTVGAGTLFGLPIAILVLAAYALLGGILLVWSSVQNLTGETSLSLEEALTLGAPSVEEEQKRAVLRALKDLEYERSVGKITTEDYQALSARYRAEAIRLMQRLDENMKPARVRAEKLLEARLAKVGLGAPDSPKEETKVAPEAKPEESEAGDEPKSEPRTNAEAPEDRTTDEDGAVPAAEAKS